VVAGTDVWDWSIVVNAYVQGTEDSIHGRNGKMDCVLHDKVAEVDFQKKILCARPIKVLKIRNKSAIPDFLYPRRWDQFLVRINARTKKHKTFTEVGAIRTLFLETTTANDNKLSKRKEKEFARWQADHCSHVQHDFNLGSLFPGDNNSNNKSTIFPTAAQTC